jgi:hypothetical protein
MMNLNNVTGDAIETILRQLGASDIKKVNGILYFIKFKLDEDVEVSYTYNINAKNKYFLQRIKPYPLPEGAFENEYEIVTFITRDLKKFNNAKNSSNYNLFKEVTNMANSITANMESLFLNNNVDNHDLTVLHKELNDVLEQINKLKSLSPKI